MSEKSKSAAIPAAKPKSENVKAKAAELKKQINGLMGKPERDWEKIDAARAELSALWDKHGKDGKLPG